MIRMQVRDLLPQGNFEVCEAKDGVEGYALIAQERPHLVLLDFFMPHMNGWEVLQKIQTEPELQTIPVVIMTGRKEEALERVPPHLFQYYECLEKPFEQKGLISAVKSAMTKAKSRQRLSASGRRSPASALTQQAESRQKPTQNQALQAQVADLQKQVRSLMTANTAIQGELNTLKQQLDELTTFVKRKL
ncbi:MAG: response regulator [Scytolyngbya sp. HA4215-MV1]|nr:response regulator [Scytolyngbya sp. HA4215-MV1]